MRNRTGDRYEVGQLGECEGVRTDGGYEVGWEGEGDEAKRWVEVEQLEI